MSLAAGGNITKFVRAALPYTQPRGAPAGLFVFPSDGYDGQFYYRLALDPANLRRTAFGITMDQPFRLQRIGYPTLAWLLSFGRHAFVPVALVAVNVLALTALAVIGGMIARNAGRHALWGILLAGYFGFFISVGCDLTEPVAAACLAGGALAIRRGKPVLAALLFSCGALTRETVLVMPLALGLTRLAAVSRGRSRLSAADLAWCLPVVVFAGWQLVVRFATGRFVLATGLSANSRSGLPGASFVDAVRLNLGLLVPPTGAAYIWLLETATLVTVAVLAAMSLRSTSGPAYERAAFVGYIVELGVLSAGVWTGHADLRSIDEVYLLAVMIVLGAGGSTGSGRRLRALAACAAVTVIVAAAHQALYL